MYFLAIFTHLLKSLGAPCYLEKNVSLYACPRHVSIQMLKWVFYEIFWPGESVLRWRLGEGDGDGEGKSAVRADDLGETTYYERNDDPSYCTHSCMSWNDQKRISVVCRVIWICTDSNRPTTLQITMIRVTTNVESESGNCTHSYSNS